MKQYIVTEEQLNELRDAAQGVGFCEGSEFAADEIDGWRDRLKNTEQAIRMVPHTKAGGKLHEHIRAAKSEHHLAELAELIDTLLGHDEKALTKALHIGYGGVPDKIPLQGPAAAVPSTDKQMLQNKTARLYLKGQIRELQDRISRLDHDARQFNIPTRKRQRLVALHNELRVVKSVLKKMGDPS